MIQFEDTRKRISEFFFSIPTLEKLPELRLAARASAQNGAKLTPRTTCLVCSRASPPLANCSGKKYTAKSFDDGVAKLRLLADFPENTRKVPIVLSEMGIRFVVIEHLPKSKIDGAALWLGDDWSKPVIALSLRYDRIDSFWHTLFHECSHIKNKDSYIVDVDIVGSDRCLSDEALSELKQELIRKP